MSEADEKAKLIKDALKIVDELGKYTFEDSDDLLHIEDKLYRLTREAKELKRNRFWKLN